MVTVQNSEVRQEIVDVSGFQQVSNSLSIDDSKVIAVVDVNPKHSRQQVTTKIHESTATAAATTTIFTVPSGKEFYLCNAFISLQKDAACDVATGTYSIYAPPYGEASNVAFIAVSFLTATAQTRDIAMTFNPPVRFKAGTLIKIAAFPYASGTSSRSAGIGGYVVEQH